MTEIYVRLVTWTGARLEEARTRLRTTGVAVGRAVAAERGQASAEYALVILAAAAVALVLIAWARSSGKLPAFFDHIIDSGEQRAVTTSRSPRRRTGERASASVEFALVLPLVLTMALGLLELGLIVKDQLVVTEAARAGARQAAVTTDDASVRQAVEQAAVSLDTTRITTSISRPSTPGGPVEVDVAYDAPIAIPLVQWLFPADVHLGARAVMRAETG